MALVTHPFADMSGPLTLVDQVSVLNPDTPIDGANVRVEMGGGISSRPGTAELGSRSPTAPARSLAFSTAGASDRLLIQEDDLLVALNMSGVLVDDQAIAGTLPVSFARFGAPGTERVYFADGDDIGFFDGSTFTLNPAGLPRPRCLAVTPWDARLVAIGYLGATDGPGGSASSPSTGHYSKEADPGDWLDTRRFSFYPGDGEAMVAACTWRDRMFIFKQTRFFVVYGTIDTGGGVPDFQHYAVEAQAGVEGPLAVCAGRDAVYFVNRRGVYATTGEEPVLLSQGLDPIFRGMSPIYWTGEVADPASFDEASVCFHDERLYVGLPTVAGGRFTLVYDPRTQWWGYDTLPVVSAATVRLGGAEAMAFAPADGGVVRYLEEGLDSDVDDPITGFWRSGWHDFGSPDVKSIRHTRVLGSGIVGIRYSADGGALLPGSQLRMNAAGDTWGDGSDPEDLWGTGRDPSDLWGQGAQYLEDWCRLVPVRGRRYSWEVRGVAPWSVQQVDHHVTTPRKPAVDLTANASA